MISTLLIYVFVYNWLMYFIWGLFGRPLPKYMFNFGRVLLPSQKPLRQSYSLGKFTFRSSASAHFAHHRIQFIAPRRNLCGPGRLKNVFPHKSKHPKTPPKHHQATHTATHQHIPYTHDIHTRTQQTHQNTFIPHPPKSLPPVPTLIHARSRTSWGGGARKKGSWLV